MSTRVRSIVTSLAGGAAELSLVALLRGVGMSAVITFAVVQLAGATTSFTLNKRWVFGAAGSGAVVAELSRSAPVLAGAFVLNTLLPTLGTGVAALPAVVAYLVSQVLVYLMWSFPLNRRWVFRTRDHCAQELHAALPS